MTPAIDEMHEEDGLAHSFSPPLLPVDVVPARPIDIEQALSQLPSKENASGIFLPENSKLKNTLIGRVSLGGEPLAVPFPSSASKEVASSSLMDLSAEDHSKPSPSEFLEKLEECYEVVERDLEEGRSPEEYCRISQRLREIWEDYERVFDDVHRTKARQNGQIKERFKQSGVNKRDLTYQELWVTALATSLVIGSSVTGLYEQNAWKDALATAANVSKEVAGVLWVRAPREMEETRYQEKLVKMNSNIQAGENISQTRKSLEEAISNCLHREGYSYRK